MKRLLVIAILTLPSLAVFAQAEYINHDGSTTGHVLKVRQDLNNGDYLHPVRVLDVTDYDVPAAAPLARSTRGKTPPTTATSSMSAAPTGGSPSNCVAT